MPSDDMPTRRGRIDEIDSAPSFTFSVGQCVMAKNQAPTIGPRGARWPAAGAGVPAGSGPYSGWNRYATCLMGSTAMVLAPFIVGTFATTVYLSGPSCRT